MQRYSCFPIKNFKIGEFHFVDGLLELEDADGERFESLLHAMHPSVQTKIRKVDEAAAHDLARRHIEEAAARGTMTSASLKAAQRFAQDAKNDPQQVGEPVVSTESTEEPETPPPAKTPKPRLNLGSGAK